MRLTSDAPTAALRPGQSFGTATLEILDQTATVLSTFRPGDRPASSNAPGRCPGRPRSILGGRCTDGVSQAVQIGGAVAILAAFAGAQARVMTVRSWAYLWLNFLGAAALAASAGYEEQWGFLLLNSVWSVVAAAGLARAAHR
jgi:hypothetical protein